MDENDPNDAWQLKLQDTIREFGSALQELHKTNPWPHHLVLRQPLNQLADDLWEFHHFNRFDVRDAWKTALSQWK